MKNNLKMVAKNGRLCEGHPTKLNEEQLKRFKEAVHWFEKATDKIAARYHRGCKQGKDRLYTEVVAGARVETEAIDEHYLKFLDGECTVEEFKEKIKIWFFKVKDGMDAADADFKQTREMF